jgi:hypothetical protein
LTIHIIQHQHTADAILDEPVAAELFEVVLDVFGVLLFVIHSVKSFGHFFFDFISDLKRHKIVCFFISMTQITRLVAHVPFLAKEWILFIDVFLLVIDFFLPEKFIIV